MYTLLYLKWMTNKDLLCGTGKSAQCYMAAWMGGEFGRELIHSMAESLHCSAEAITTMWACVCVREREREREWLSHV